MIHIFSAINEVAVFGTACVLMAVHTLWYSSVHFLVHGGTATKKQHAWTILVPFLCYAVILTFVAYAVSFAVILKMGTLHISSLIALFAVTVQVSVFEANKKSFTEFLGDVGFILICIIGGAFVLQYWPW